MKISFIDIETNQVIDSFPLHSEFIFDNVYAEYTGDKRALEKTLTPFLTNQTIPFPTNEQMGFDTLKDKKGN